MEQSPTSQMNRDTHGFSKTDAESEHGTAQMNDIENQQRIYQGYIEVGCVLVHWTLG